MSHEFEHIDDFEYILPDWGENAFTQHISHFFKKYNLLFGLVEIATIKNRTGVGDIYLWSDLNPEAANQRLTDYKSIIEKVQLDKKINLSEYKEWYEFFNHSYVLTCQNERNKVHRSYNKYNFHWAKFEQNGEYPFVDKESLEDESVVLDYLNYYADLMHNEFKLSNYPHYAIIIKPISFPIPENNNITYPVGTFYLHFATAKPVGQEYYLKFINEFFIVWLKDYGITLIEEFKKVTPTEDKAYLPPFSQSLKKEKKLKIIEPYLKEIYTKHKDEFESELYEVCGILLEDLVKDNDTIDDQLYNRFRSKGITDFFDDVRLTQTKKIEQFKKVLIQREVFKLMLISGKPPARIHNYLKENELGRANPHDKLSYFWVNRFIPIKCKPGDKTCILVDKTKQEIKQYMSDWEKSFVVEYIKIAQNKNESVPQKKEEIISELMSLLKS